MTHALTRNRMHRVAMSCDAAPEIPCGSGLRPTRAHGGARPPINKVTVTRRHADALSQ